MMTGQLVQQNLQGLWDQQAATILDRALSIVTGGLLRKEALLGLLGLAPY